jgi:hypothetical protein
VVGKEARTDGRAEGGRELVDERPGEREADVGRLELLPGEGRVDVALQSDSRPREDRSVLSGRDVVVEGRADWEGRRAP